MNKLALEKVDRNSLEYQKIKVSEEEGARRRNIQQHSLGSFSVDNLPLNPETRYLFNDFVEGRIATS